MILAVTNQKGGVGKTTTCLNLGAAAALDGKRTLLVDLDPQGNLTKTLIQPGENQPGAYSLLNYSPLRSLGEGGLHGVIVPTQMPNLSLVPADISLATLERAAALDKDLPYRLREKLRPDAEEFDLVIIDTPPTLGALTINAMAAATHLLVPIQSSFYCLHGANDLLDTYKLVKSRFNPSLELLGVLVTLHDPRTTLGQEVIEEIRRAFGGKVLEAVIHRSVKLEESPAGGQSVLTHAPKSAAAAQYLAAYRELTDRA